mgnify:CR=1 FL=1
MNWIKNFVRPKIRSILGTDKREVPENMWVKDPDSGQMVFYKDLEANQFVFPNSGYHERMTAPVRVVDCDHEEHEAERVVARIQSLRAGLGQAHALLPGSVLHGDPATPIARVHTDTRTLQAGDLFLALCGERFDAHDFLPQAAQSGAVAVIGQRGVAESLDAEGALLLRTQHGRLERILGGDVTVEK